MTLHAVLAALLLFSASCYAVMGLRLIIAKREVGSRPIGALFIVIGLWVLGGAIELLSNTFFMFSVGRTGHFVGSALLPVGAYVCFREYIGLSTSVHRVTLLLLIPLVSITLAATNYFHEFMWYLPATDEAGRFLTRPQQWGPWFRFVHAPHSYLVIGTGLLALLTHISAVARGHRRGILMLAAASFGPLAATLAYDLGFGPDTISFVPFVFALMLPLYTWLVVAEQVVNFSPLAYETVFENMQDPLVVIDDEGRIIGLNRRAEALLSISETAALFEPLNSVICDGSTEVFEAMATGEPRKMMTSTGRFLHVQVSEMNTNGAGERKGKVLMFRDVSDVEKAQAEVRANERLLRTLIDHSVNGIIRLQWDAVEGEQPRELRCIFCNAAAAKFLTTDGDRLLGMAGEDIVKLASNAMSAGDAEGLGEDFSRAILANERLDAEVQHVSGTSGKWLRMIVEPFGSDIAITFVDITDGKAKEEHMESIARSDPLTGVLNRRGFEHDASQRLTESADDATGALLFIDLNDFKVINDNFGHEVGDQLLTVAARRLRKSLRSCDIIGRPGGDEFVALVPDVSAEVAGKLAQRLTVALEEPYVIGAQRHYCAASIGLALYPRNANTLTGLMREADQAMYRAKARCRGVSNVSSEDLLEKAV
ncbi:MAG: diguanylate cyclase [Gammaproteobacteria bacterium]|nr:diguanylate cyclase [Gammaproteobacteria bacterium]MDH5304770.1 diguanylate cyclase [Gammaproteobacteria bacterium]MDH5322403.1 diguanylate cyclase [Gammaproteobacteria bacterium]